MLKKVLTTALFGAALGIAVANAAVPGIYVTGQLGYAQTQMNNKTKFNPSEIGAGISNVFPSVESTTFSGKANAGNNGLAGRLAIGYQLNSNLAIEMGYLQLQQGKSGNFSFNDKAGKKIAQANLTLNQYAIDVAAKGIIPIANNLNLYGKLGVAYLKNDIEFNGKFNKNKTIPVDINGKLNVNDLTNIKRSQWAPEVAIGISYDVTQNVSIDTSWTHIHTIGKNRVGNVDFVAAGVSYNFG
ncbi:outer membrane beta-barrel protein [Rickettsiella massiliensis]|uniref:outer membrane beta-barrel protein n=1 Tax=Rickettsiella massiliensis TaxID=676517 RepID=UPI00029B3C0D|nr:outer membrane beta-barrel protein [Rickettsiella massiliensis]